MIDSNYLGIHHCEILVTDLNKALKFYIEVLGLEEINNTSSFSESKWLRFLILLLGVYGLVLLV